MAEIHILNVGQGDCTIIRSNSGHITMFDICGGNIEPEIEKSAAFIESKKAVRGNFRMCKHPINPIEFLMDKMGKTEIFRFILSHPDMDHLDGFDNLVSNVTILNYWDSGVRRDKPDFSKGYYKEEDWDRYVKVRDGKGEDIKVVTPRAGGKGKYWNEDDQGKGGDYITICSPSQELVNAANDSEGSEAINDASYVINYNSSGGRILLPGDAHDKTWEYVLENYKEKLKNCEFMLAPHHGRDSSRSWSFLDELQPTFSVLGCAASKDLGYAAWNTRGLDKITQNQAGNISIYPEGDGLDIYVENEKFVNSYGGDVTRRDNYENYFLDRVDI